MSTRKDIEKYIEEVRKVYGDNSIYFASECSPTIFVPTMIPYFDLTLGGGVASHRFFHIFGWESTGKTRTTFRILSQFQKVCLVCGKVNWFKECACYKPSYAGYVEVEHAMDRHWLGKTELIGENIIVRQPASAEEAIDAFIELVEMPGVAAVALDSVAALCSIEEQEKDASQTVTMGKYGRATSALSRKLCACLNRSHKKLLGLIFVNQLRSTMSRGFQFGPLNVPSGGSALKFYSSQTVRLSSFRKIFKKDKKYDPFKGKESSVETFIGRVIKFQLDKSKVSPPHRESSFKIYSANADSKTNYARAGMYNVEEQVVLYLTDMGVFERDKNSYVYEKKKHTIGWWIRYFKKNPDLFSKLVRQVYDDIQERLEIKYIDSVIDEVKKPKSRKTSGKGKKRKSSKKLRGGKQRR